MDACKKFLKLIPISLAVIAHASLGVHPIFGKYLQQIRGIPTFSLAALVHMIAFIAMLPRLLYILFKLIRKHGKNIFKEELFPILKNWLLWAFVINVNVLNFCYVGSSSLTLASYTQLILITTPFMVAILGRIFLKEKVNIATWFCMVIMVIGGALVVLGGATKHETGSTYKFEWLIDFTKLGEGLTIYDGIGMILSLVSSFLMAIYMLIIKYSQSQGKEKFISSEAFYFWQIGSCSICGIPVSFILGEDWNKYYNLGWSGWLILIAYGIISFFIGSLTQILAIEFMGAPATSSLLALRLVVAVIFGMLLLNEILNNFWQIVGCVIVIVTVTLYMSYNYYLASQQSRTKTEDLEKQKNEEKKEIEHEMKEVEAKNDTEQEMNDVVVISSNEDLENPKNEERKGTEHEEKKEIEHETKDVEAKNETEYEMNDVEKKIEENKQSNEANNHVETNNDTEHAMNNVEMISSSKDLENPKNEEKKEIEYAKNDTENVMNNVEEKKETEMNDVAEMNETEHEMNNFEEQIIFL